MFSALMLLMTTLSFANDIAFDEDVQDNATAVPINDYIIEALIIGSFVVFYSIKKTALKK
jgi:hypothetical protein